MDRKAFSLLHAMEDSWWYRGRARVISRVLPLIGTRGGRALDLGAGYGGMIHVLKGYAKEIEGTEPDEESRLRASGRGYARIYPELADARPPYALVAMFDVLEHVEDDHALLSKLHGMLEPRGYLALTVPAFQWLWSEHDVLHHHFRRYTSVQVRAALERVGFEIIYTSYWNMLLFFPAAIVRILGRSGAGSLALPRWLDSVFYSAMYVESLYLPWLRLPFGTGIVALARKK